MQNFIIDTEEESEPKKFKFFIYYSLINLNDPESNLFSQWVKVNLEIKYFRGLPLEIYRNFALYFSIIDYVSLYSLRILILLRSQVVLEICHPK